MEFFKTVVDQEAFHTQRYKKASDFARGHASVQRAENGIQRTGVNGYNGPFVNNGFTKHVFTFKSNF